MSRIKLTKRSFPSDAFFNIRRKYGKRWIAMNTKANPLLHETTPQTKAKILFHNNDPVRIWKTLRLMCEL